MKQTKTAVYPTVLILLLFFILSACGSEPADTQNAPDVDTSSTLDPAQFADFSALVEQTRVNNEIPGAAVALVENDQTIFAEGFGVRNIDSDEPVTPETIFHIGSTHKSITAMLIATLVDDGYLEWDTPVVDLYADFELSDPSSTQQVTIRHLLSMSSGIPAEAEDRLGGDLETAEDVLALLPRIPITSQPGEQFSYSNISTSVAGYIGALTAADQQASLYDSYDQLLQARIFDPIGMETATLSVEEAWDNPNHAVSHVFSEDGDVIAADSYDFTGDPLAPSGAIKASILDMALYLGTQIQRGVAPNGTRVVSEASLTETWQPEIADPESGGHYGMGWGINEEGGLQIIWHEGSYDNFTSLLIFIPEVALGAVLLTNIDDPGTFLEEISEAFIELGMEIGE